MTDVVIVGGGIAGLSAAVHLQRAGISVVVVEARDRPGGRLQTVCFGDTLMDIGGAWLHGDCDDDALGQKNVLRDLIRESGCSLIPTSSNNVWMLGETGDNCPAFDQLMKRISQGGFEDSFEDAVLEVFGAVALNELDEDVRKRLHGIELWMGAPLSELSAEEFEDFDIQTTWGDFPGAHALIGNGGYSRVIDHLRCQLAPNSLLLNAEVVHIDSSRSTEVVLQTKAGDELHAKCCICTVPLGVLKVRWAELFHPVLPKSTVSAIEQLGFAQYSKLAVRMSAQFWEEVVPASVKERMWLWNPTPHTPFPFLLNYSKFKSCPVVLGLSVHKISSEEAVHAFSEAFATHCATDAATILSNMDDVLFVDWSTDRFSLGAYSFFKVGCDWDAVDRLCDPAAVSASTRVRLAGEHCHAEYQGSVHAALLSGISVADSLLREFFSSGE